MKHPPTPNSTNAWLACCRREACTRSGGRVRDEIRLANGQITSAPDRADLDYLIIGLTTDRLLERLTQIGRVDVVGAAFAVVKLTVDRRTVDVGVAAARAVHWKRPPRFRGPKRPDVPLEDDLARRDFRINMLARALPSGAVVDPTAAQTISRIAESTCCGRKRSKKILCACCAPRSSPPRFEYELTPRTLEAMTAAAPLTKAVSPERIADELTKLLVQAERPSTGLEILRKTGVLAEFWPELAEGYGVEQNEWHAYDVWYHAMATVDATPPGDLTLRLAALLHDVGKPRTKDGPHFYRHEAVGSELAVSMHSRLRFPNDLIDDVSQLVAQHMFAADPELSDAAVRRFIRRVGVDRVERLFAVRQADVAGSGLPKARRP